MTQKSKKTAKLLWEAGVILLLNLALLCAAGDKKAQSLFGGDRAVYSRLGERSEEVRRVQKALEEKGFYNEKITGFFDLATKKALTDFQEAHGLPQSGGADGETLDALGVKPENNTCRCDTEVLLLARFIESAGEGKNEVTCLLIGAAAVNKAKENTAETRLSTVIFGAMSEYITDKFFEEPSSEAVALANACLNGIDPGGGGTGFCSRAFSGKKRVVAESEGLIFYLPTE